MRRDKQFAYTRTARDQVALYSIEPNLIESSISSVTWNRVGKKGMFEIRFLHKRALFSVKFIDYKEYILIVSIHKTTSRIAIRKAKRK